MAYLEDKSIIINDESTNATNYLAFVNAVSGKTELRADSGLNFNPSTGVLTIPNLVVTGANSTFQTEDVKIYDNIVILNSNEAGTPSQDAGIEVERGTSSNVQVLWDESTDRWTFTNNGTNYYNIPITGEYSNNAGTVTSVATDGTAILGGAITTTGTISHSTASGYKHIPSGGSSGQILRWSSDGVAVWGADTDTVYTHPTYTYSALTADAITTLASIPLISTLTQTNGHVTGGTYRKLVAGTNVTIIPTADGNVTINSPAVGVTSVSAGNGMNFTAITGTGTVTLGTPTALSASTTDAVTATSHTHSISTATAVALTNASASGAGTSASLARADHTHAISGFALSAHSHASGEVSSITYAVAMTALAGASSVASNGQLLIGDGADFTKATLTAGNGIGITNGAGSITIKTSATVSTKTGAYTATSNDNVILCDATTAGFTLTLPAVASSSGTVYTIKKIDSSVNAVTIDANSTELIDGLQTFVLAYQFQSIDLVCNGSAWYIV